VLRFSNRSSSNLFLSLFGSTMALAAASQCLQPRRHSTQLSAHRPPSLLRSRVHTIAFLRPAGAGAAESTSGGPSANWNKLCCRRRQELLRIRPLVLLPSPKDVSVRAVDDGRGDVPSKGYTVSEELETPTDGSPAGTCDPLCSVDDMSSMDFQASYKPKSDLLKAVSVSTALLGGAAIINHSWVAENQVCRLQFGSVCFWMSPQCVTQACFIFSNEPSMSDL
jgi:hypothetical protein